MNSIAARSLAEDGFPIFPVRPRGKEPLTTHGFKDATTNLETITLWWVLEPDANIATPTGRITVLDVDRDKGGERSLSELQRDTRKLPKTFTVRTGGGGRHLYFRRPPEAVRNSTGKLGVGLDIRAEGGYILLPPSRTAGPYKCLNELSIAPFPTWLLERLRDPKPAVQNSSGPVDMDPLGAPIYRGTRNTTLTSIAGSLRARGHSREEIEQHLHEVNVSRCRPHLPIREVARIAESISRYPAGKARPATTPEVRAALDRIEGAVLTARWAGMGGATDRAVLVALIALSRSYGILIPAGVRVSVAQRDLALLSGVGLRAVVRCLKRLKKAGLLTADNATRKPGEAGALVLRVPKNLPQGDYTLPSFSRHGKSVVTLGESLPALRHGPGRLGKRAGEVLSALVAAGGEATLHELVRMTGVRRDHLKTRYIRRLSDAGIVVVEGETVRLSEAWREKLEVARDVGGELDSERADRRRYAAEREAFHQKLREEPNYE